MNLDEQVTMKPKKKKKSEKLNTIPVTEFGTMDVIVLLSGEEGTHNFKNVVAVFLFICLVVMHKFSSILLDAGCPAIR